MVSVRPSAVPRRDGQHQTPPSRVEFFLISCTAVGAIVWWWSTEDILFTTPLGCRHCLREIWQILSSWRCRHESIPFEIRTERVVFLSFSAETLYLRNLAPWQQQPRSTHRDRCVCPYLRVALGSKTMSVALKVNGERMPHMYVSDHHHHHRRSVF